ncbi:hypothetical protein [Streptomyces cinnamoneus]|nr:hypothetical protein [Streptomyces cinnamoneus]
MWSAEDVTRDSVRRHGEGLNAAQVEQRVEEAAVRERETRRQLRQGGHSSEFASDPERLAAIWAAKHVEWRRVRDLMLTSGWDTYETEQDIHGSEWARERDSRRQAALEARAEFAARRREAADELRTELWLTAASSHLIRAAATRAGLVPARVLAQLAERIVVHEDGTVSVPPFTPTR